MAPLRPSLGGEVYEDDVPVVLALSWGEGKRDSATLGVVLNENGDVVRRLKLDRLIDHQRYREDFDALAEVMEHYKPDAIVVGGFTPATKTLLLPRLQECMMDIPGTRDHRPADVPMLFVEDDVARLYMNSERGRKDFPESEVPPLLRYMVSLGRRLQSPVSEVAALCNPHDDIKDLVLSPFQKYVPYDKVKESLARAFMNVVSSCGVDMNAAVAHPHLAHTLQFVAGLGPRKAQAILSTLQLKGGKLESRANLVVEHKVMGGKVFANCASFLRIRSYHFRKAYMESLDVLDDSRVHPEDYEYAQKMAADALELEDTAADADDNPSAHVRELMEARDFAGLHALELDDFAAELERTRGVKKKLKLAEIKAELMAPYAEKRPPFRPASVEQVFSMLSGETPETLYRGLCFSVCITRSRPGKFATCRLGSGLEGFLFAEDLEPQTAATIDVNSAVEVCVLNIDPEKFTVNLGNKLEDLRRAPVPVVDPSFSFERLESDKYAHNGRGGGG